MTPEEFAHALEEVILGPVRFTPPEIIEEAGAEREAAIGLWTELGFPPIDDDSVHFTDGDLQILRALVEYREQGDVGEDVVVPLARVLGQALSKVAAAQVEIFKGRLNEVVGTIDEETSVEDLNYLVEVFVSEFERFMGYVWRRHLVAALRRELSGGERSSEVVGFADLVGFTRETRDYDDERLGALIDRFQRAAYDRITDGHGRVVKVVGDGVMFTAPDVTAAARIALGLVDVCGTDVTLPDIRVGIASGPVLALEGDIFGRTVNRASRLADRAHPNSVLADDTTGQELAATEAISLRRLRPIHLKGLGHEKSWVVRPDEY